MTTYFGGKSRIAGEVWRRLGNVDSYVEAFAGSAAVLLARPDSHRWWEQTETINDLDGMVCVGPETRLLTGDLRWRQAKDFRIGDAIIGFDESNGSPQTGIDRRLDRPLFQPPTQMRRWRLTTVTAIRYRITDCYRLTFEDGTQVVCSSEHRWLSGKSKTGGRGARWIETRQLRCDGSQYASHVMKLCEVVNREESFENGWLSGFFDGEGNIKGTGAGWAVCVTQKHGPELDMVERLLHERGFVTTRVRSARAKDHHSPTSSLQIRGGMREILRFLMLCRPQRLLETALVRLSERSIYARERQVVRLVRKEHIGEHEVVSIATGTNTFIAEGLASHNCNTWRAIAADPEAVAHYADQPVFENNLHAIHIWLVRQKLDLVARLEGNPEYYDAKIAGWWLWGIACWIGSGWCSGKGPWTSVDGKLVRRGNEGQGVKRPIVDLHNDGRGVNRRRVHLSDDGQGVCEAAHAGILDWMQRLQNRLRRVRVCSGDWKRVVTPAAMQLDKGLVGIVLDPPYSQQAGRDMHLYAEESGDVAHEVRKWALANGDDPRLRIAVCGYDREMGELPKGWTECHWSAQGGYGVHGQGQGRENREQETIWFSPHCLRGDEVKQLGWEL